MKTLTRLALTATLALAPFAALAQEAETATDTTEQTTDVINNTAFGDWIVNCQALTAKRTSCRLVQEQSLRDSGAFVARFIGVPVSDGAILLAQVPMGVYLPGGAVYRFAGNEEIEQREMIWQRCADDVCEAAAPLTEEELALFAEEDTMLFGFRPVADGEPVILSVDISEFADAIQKLRESNS
ncbi:invasion associated locus B family protein [Celeribacter sp. ULVN23_4]